MAGPYRIALVWQTNPGHYGEQAVRGVGAYCARFDTFQMLINRSGEFDPAHMSSRSDIQGVIVYQTGKELLDLDWPTHCPIVSVGLEPNAITPWQVLPDDQAAGRLVAEDFLGRHFKRLAYCPIPRLTPVVECERWDQDRRKGFSDAAHAAGVQTAVFPGTPGVWGNYQQEWKSTLAEWIKSLAKPVGIMAAKDLRARHVLAAAEFAHIKVPEEIAVVGVDNDPWVQLSSRVGISTVELDGFGAGYAAARLLHHLLEGKSLPSPIIRVPPRRLIARRSSDALAIDDQDVITALHFIAERAAKGISVRQVVDAVPLSRRTLERRFQMTVGCSILAKIRLVQVERAKALLGDESIPLGRVAQLSGFRSTDAFGRVFRRVTRLTPSSFRKTALDSGLDV